jgi:hypothetical protein
MQTEEVLEGIPVFDSSFAKLSTSTEIRGR